VLFGFAGIAPFDPELFADEVPDEPDGVLLKFGP